MKHKITSGIICLLLLAPALTTLGQDPNEKKQTLMVGTVDINDLADLHYIQVLGVKTDGTLTLEVDYGKKIQADKRLVMGSNKKPEIFDTMVAALNYLHTHGWEFVNAYEGKALEGPAYHFILKRRSADGSTDLTKK